MSAYTLEFYEDPNGRQPVRDWIKEELTPEDRRSVGAAMRPTLHFLVRPVLSKPLATAGDERGQEKERRFLITTGSSGGRCNSDPLLVHGGTAIPLWL